MTNIAVINLVKVELPKLTVVFKYLDDTTRVVLLCQSLKLIPEQLQRDLTYFTRGVTLQFNQLDSTAPFTRLRHSILQRMGYHALYRCCLRASQSDECGIFKDRII